MTTAWVPLATTTLTSTDAEIVFSSIPATYRDLVLVANFSRDNVSVSNDYIKLNTSTADFTNVQLFGNGSAAYSATESVNRISTYTVTAGRIYNVILQIMDYSATDKHKTIFSRYNKDDAGVGVFAARWAQTTAVNSVSFYVTPGSFQVGSTFSLYGSNRL